MGGHAPGDLGEDPTWVFSADAFFVCSSGDLSRSTPGCSLARSSRTSSRTFSGRAGFFPLDDRHLLTSHSHPIHPDPRFVARSSSCLGAAIPGLVVRVRHGFDIPCKNVPVQRSVPREVGEEARKVLRPMKRDQVEKGFVSVIPGPPRLGPDVFYMMSFPVAKPRQPGKFRDCLNAVPLNDVTHKTHFKGEGMDQLIDSLLPGDWAVTTDWSSWFNHGRLTERSKKLCRTTLDGIVYQSNVVQFGLHNAPGWMAELVKPVFALLRAMGVRVAGQTDDWAWLGRSFMEALAAAQLGAALFTTLGVVFNSKGSRIPSRRFVHLGGFFDTTLHYAFLTRHRREAIVSLARELLDYARAGRRVNIRMLASLVGKANAARHFVTVHRLVSRDLERMVAEVSHLRGWNARLFISPLLLPSLLWWSSELSRHNGAPLHLPDPSHTIVKDASQWAWGAVLEETGEETFGFWSRAIAGGHSTLTEVHADIQAATAFIRLHNLRSQVIHIRSDATTSVSYINRHGGRKPHLNDPVVQFLWRMWQDRRILFTASHIPGVENVAADRLSRVLNPWTELELAPWAFQEIEHRWGPHSVDLMASSVNALIPRFFSWRVDPAAAGTDALTQDWSTETNPYLFPPDALIPRALHHARACQAPQFTMVTFLWPSRHWFPMVMSLAVKVPVFLPPHLVPVRLPPMAEGRSSPVSTSVLVVWRLCAKRWWDEGSRRRHSISSDADGLEMASTWISPSSDGSITATQRGWITSILSSLRSCPTQL